MEIKELLKKLREERGLTQQDVADALEVGRVTYARYENGTRLPSHEMLVRLSKFFNCTTDYLLGITDEPNLVHYKLPDDYKIDGESVAIDIVKEALDKGLTEDDLKDIIDMALKLRGKK